MDQTRIANAATQAIGAFGNTAHSAIDAWREGGEALGRAAASRWDSAFREAAPKLSAETRRNATHARKVFAGYYNRGLALSTGGAGVVVDTLVGAATAGVQRASAFAQARAR